MERVIAFRHGEKTHDTNKNEIGGQRVLLTPRGEAQITFMANAIGQRFPEVWGSDVMLSSPMDRAKRSAEITARILNIRDIVEVPELTEFRVSKHPDAKVRKLLIARMLLDPDYEDTDPNTEHNLHETMRQKAQRFLGVFDVHQPKPDIPLLVASHGLSIRGAAFVQNPELRPDVSRITASIQEGGYTIFERLPGEEFNVAEFNVHDFLPGELKAA